MTGPGGVSILTPSDFGNADLAPERGEELEVGFDASLWGERLGLNFTAYWRTTKDAIVEQPIPPSLGFPSNQLVNIGEIKNWGTETELSVQVLTEDPLRWDLSVTFATLDNEITDLGGVTSIPVRRGRFHIEGYPLANIFSEKVVGATFLSGSRGEIDRATVMCDGGAGADGRRFGGTPILCDDPITGESGTRSLVRQDGTDLDQLRSFYVDALYRLDALCPGRRYGRFQCLQRRYRCAEHELPEYPRGQLPGRPDFHGPEG